MDEGEEVGGVPPLPGARLYRPGVLGLPKGGGGSPALVATLSLRDRVGGNGCWHTAVPRPYVRLPGGLYIRSIHIAAKRPIHMAAKRNCRVPAAGLVQNGCRRQLPGWHTSCFQTVHSDQRVRVAFSCVSHMDSPRATSVLGGRDERGGGTSGKSAAAVAAGDAVQQTGGADAKNEGGEDGEHLLQLRAEPVDVVLQVARWLLALHHCDVGP